MSPDASKFPHYNDGVHVGFEHSLEIADAEQEISELVEDATVAQENLGAKAVHQTIPIRPEDNGSGHRMAKLSDKGSELL